MTGPYLIGVDCGTQSAKVVVYDAAGTAVAGGQHMLRPMSRPQAEGMGPAGGRGFATNRRG